MTRPVDGTPAVVPSVPDLFHAAALAIEREKAQQIERKLAESLDVLRRNPRDETASRHAAECLRKLDRCEAALAVLHDGIFPGCSVHAHLRYINMLAMCNRTREAIAAAARAIPLFPGNLLLKMREALLLPIVYASTAEIDWYRDRYAIGLERLTREIPLNTRSQRRLAVAALGEHANIYLAYQNHNDLDLQILWGNLAHRIMSAAYPRWAGPVSMPSVADGGQIRVGFVSARFRDLSATRFFLGWLRELDRRRFRVYSWQVSPTTDTSSDDVSRYSYVYRHIHSSVGRIGASIRRVNLHALVFVDVGVEPIMTQLAACRLAPVQCMAWDHPVTSGIPTIDYALTGALSEPNGAEAHYSERLVRLPGVGVCFRKPAVPVPLLKKTRRDFSLRDDATVFLCCQSVCKFLPENDEVFVRIARHVPNAQFVFLIPNELVGADFRRRLRAAFAAAGLDADRFCTLQPQMKHLDYWNLHLVADVFLDTIGWSSGGSVFEAIACRLPVVTLPGKWMRSRQGYAILSQLGVTETIARDTTEYVGIAVRLARDRVFRQSAVKRGEENNPLLFSDTRCVRALEEFLEARVTGQ